MKTLKEIAEELIYMDTIQATETEWLWYPYIPFGKITVIQGDPGEGKTTLILNIAARLTKGILPQSQEKCEPMNVIYQTAEDGLSDTVKPRLLSAGADCSKVIVINESERNISMSDKRLEAAIAHTHAKLVILDPLQAYLGAEVDMHRANEIRPVMSHLASIAEKYGCAVVLIGHMNKAMGMKSTYRGLGSIDITAAARSILLVARDRSDRDRRIVMQIKSSLAKEGKPLAFRMGDNYSFTYEGECEADPDNMLLGIGTVQPKQSDLARKFLMAELGGGEAKPVRALTEKAAEIGVSYDNLKKYKDELGIKSVRCGSTWEWQM